MDAPPSPPYEAATPNRWWRRMAVLGIVLGLLGIVVTTVRQHQARSPVPADPLAALADPLVRAWLHAYEADAHEVDMMRRQPPDSPTRPGESLVDEQDSLRRTWTGLARAWLAAGGQLRDCPGVEARTPQERARVLELQREAGDRLPPTP